MTKKTKERETSDEKIKRWNKEIIEVIWIAFLSTISSIATVLLWQAL